MRVTRYAIYHLPAPAPWVEWATGWLGWDCVAGTTVAAPATTQDAHVHTNTARRYGLHATIKPPFALATDRTAEELEAALARHCAACAPTPVGALKLSALGRFLALIPEEQNQALTDLAAQTVRALDPFRAPMTTAERDHRARPGMRGALQDNLDRWGYAHVMEAFRYHITLSDRLDTSLRDDVADALTEHLMPLVPSDTRLDRLALMGEDEAGLFHALASYPLTGAAS